MTLTRLGMIIFAIQFLTACGGLKDLSYATPPVYFAYPSDIPIITEQSEVSTIIITRSMASGLSVDGRPFHSESTPLRAVNKSDFKNALA